MYGKRENNGKDEGSHKHEKPEMLSQSQITYDLRDQNNWIRVTKDNWWDMPWVDNAC